MKQFKSHFWYSKSQRNGIFFLLVFIVLFQAVYFFVDFSSNEKINYNSTEVQYINKKLDSLCEVAQLERIPKIYPFNPNFITDYKGYKLGMTTEEIDRLHVFRSHNKYVNTAKEFQKVTLVNDSLLNALKPYFKFPKWITSNRSFSNKTKANTSIDKTTISTTDLNLATVTDLKTITGVGDKLANRIVNYRKKIQGYTFNSQLKEVWGLKQDLVQNVLKVFSIHQKPAIFKINLNTATFKQVLQNPYVNYELCKKIFDYRDEVAELQDISELKNIEGFPIEKYDRIILYLETK